MRLSRKESSGILSPSEAAELLDLSPSYIRKCCDEGTIPNTYRIGASKDRRIPAKSIKSFLVQTNMPVPAEVDRLVTVQESYERKISTAPKQ